MCTAESPYCYEAEEHECQSTHVDGRSAKMRKEKATDDATNNVACGKGNIDVECLKFGKPRRLEKDDRVSKNRVSAEDLCRPDYAILQRTVSVSAISRSNTDGKYKRFQFAVD